MCNGRVCAFSANLQCGKFKTRVLKEGQENMMAPTTVLLIKEFTCPHAGYTSAVYTLL